MDIPADINSQLATGLGMPLQNFPGQPGKIGEDGASFNEIYNAGLNGLKSSVSEPAQGVGIQDFIKDVDQRSKEASSIRADALSGGSSTLHQAMIASQEAGVSFTLLVEMRNKLLETYQELMRMQV